MDVDIIMKFGIHVLDYIIYYLKKYLENFRNRGHLKFSIVNNFLIFHFIKIGIIKYNVTLFIVNKIIPYFLRYDKK